MLLETNVSTVTNINTASSFKIDASEKAFKVLSNNLYSDKIQSIIRELSANAYDSHVEAGKKDVPFEVHLPTSGELYFSIRDYGVGLSPIDMEEVYTTYFSSTKTGSNAYIGAFGLGSKTPFSYTDSFQVTSWYEGTKYNYIASILNGTPSIVLLGKSESDEPTGLMVKFATKRQDTYDFENKALDVYKFFEVLPESNLTLTHIDRSKWVKVSDTVSLCPNNSYSTDTYIIQGNIAYKITDYKYLKHYEDLFITVPIGSVDMTVSRESLEMTDKTVKVLDNAMEEYSKHITSAYADSDTPIHKIRSTFDNKFAYSVFVQRYCGSLSEFSFDEAGILSSVSTTNPLGLDLRNSRGFRLLLTGKLYINRQNRVWVIVEDILTFTLPSRMKGAIRSSKADVLFGTKQQYEEFTALQQEIYDFNKMYYFTPEEFIEEYNPKITRRRVKGNLVLGDFYANRWNNSYTEFDSRTVYHTDYIKSIVAAGTNVTVLTRSEGTHLLDTLSSLENYLSGSYLILQVSEPNKKALLGIEGVQTVEDRITEYKNLYESNKSLYYQLYNVNISKLISLLDHVKDIRSVVRSPIRKSYREVIKNSPIFKILSLLFDLHVNKNLNINITAIRCLAVLSDDCDNLESNKCMGLGRLVLKLYKHVLSSNNQVTRLQNFNKPLYTYGGNK